jgi:hypothetical protein
MIPAINSEALVDFIDLINFTLSKDFVEKWKYKYSEKFIKLFQLKILTSISKGSIIKTKTLYKYLTKNHKYSRIQVVNFFESIDIESYSPLISGPYSI